MSSPSLRECGGCHHNFEKQEFSGAQLRRTVNLRRCKRCVTRLEPGNAQKQSKNLLKWLSDNGADVGNIEIREIASEFRAVYAKTRILSGDVMRIPLACLMTTEKAKNSLIGRQVLKSGWSPSHDHTFLALFVLEEFRKGPGPSGSFFWPYLCMLPLTYDNVPLFWDDAVLSQRLDPACFAHQMVRHHRKAFEFEHAQLRLAVPDFPCTLREFTWARVVVVTRVFSMPPSHGLGPLADKLNHGVDANTAWKYRDEDQAFAVWSSKRILQGMEIKDSYGPKCNSRYFVNYGFVLEDAEAESANQNQGSFFVSQRPENWPDPPRSYDDGFCGYNRAVVMGWEEKIRLQNQTRFQIPDLSRFGDSAPELDHCLKYFRALAKGDERAALERLERCVRSRLEQEFRSTIEEDETRLPALKKFSPERDALVVQLSEKRTLRRIADACSRILKASGQDSKEFKWKAVAAACPDMKGYVNASRPAA